MVGIFGSLNEYDRGVELCREVCRKVKLSHDDCMKRTPDETTYYGISYAVSDTDKRRISVWFQPLRSQNNIPERLIRGLDINEMMDMMAKTMGDTIQDLRKWAKSSSRFA